MTDLSVSIVNTNSRELLLACLDSLAGTEAEIVVLDNASEDGSGEAVRALAMIFAAQLATLIGSAQPAEASDRRLA